MKNGFITINLMPYREKQKANAVKRFAFLVGGFALGGLILVGMVHGVISFRIEEQKNRNNFITSENKKLDETIKSIAKLKEEIKLTLAKRKVVEQLQANRSDAINIVNTVANTIPEDTFLNSVKKEDENVTIVGQTYSNNKVSHYMVGLEESQIFKDPTLKEIKAKNIDNSSLKNRNRAKEVKISEFSLVLKMERTDDESLSSNNKNNKKVNQ